MWKREIAGRELWFRLAGLNNQNFLMTDEQTRSWWQQVSGEAVLGPLKGKRLELVRTEEISFGIWKREHPGGTVLAPVDGWKPVPVEVATDISFVPAPADPGDSPLHARDVVVGVSIGNLSKAYPMTELRKQNPVKDDVGDLGLLLVIAADAESVRCFDRTVDGQRLDLFLIPGAGPLTLVDAKTGSEWDFSGAALNGPLRGRRLDRSPSSKEHWFSWKNYHPGTRVFTAGR